MYFFDFILKFFVAVLIFRMVLTQQELMFNSMGRGVAKLTDFLFKNLGRTKKSNDKLIPLMIIIIVGLYGILLGFFDNNILFSVVKQYINFANFITMFFMCCILLGILAPQYSSAFPQFFYRLGNIWVKPGKQIIPLKGNFAAISGLLLLLAAYMGVFIILSLVSSLISSTGVVFDLKQVIISSLLVYTSFFADILRGLSFVILTSILLSWFSPDPRNILVQLVYYISEPVIKPFRKVIPPIGMFDFSALVALIVVRMLASVVMIVLARISVLIS